MRTKINEISYKRILFCVLLVLSPGFWWIIFKPLAVSSELTKFPTYFREKTTTIFSIEKLSFIQEMRWSAFGKEKDELISRVYYNKALILVENSFEYLSLLSPRIYFQAGDGTEFSPPRVEPIPAILFFFWIFGLVRLIKQRKFKILLFLFVSPILAFLAGRRNLVFLFPTFIFYLYVASLGFDFLFRNHPKKGWMIRLLVIYSLFIIGRVLWIVY
ncbi:MAG: hypothetical protein P8Y17_02075 [Patescibacteria group bacterium]